MQLEMNEGNVWHLESFDLDLMTGEPESIRIL
jgi:hypothetical protein